MNPNELLARGGVGRNDNEVLVEVQVVDGRSSRDQAIGTLGMPRVFVTRVIERLIDHEHH
jgi:hypothetical protein